MPWYYIEAHHGGGHQSTTSRWIWRDEAVPIKTSEDIENLVDGEFAGYFGGDSVIFFAKRVTKLPHSVRKNLLEAQRAAIEQALHMESVLVSTPTHPRRCFLYADMMDRKSLSRELRECLTYKTPQARCLKAEGHRGKCVANQAKRKMNRERFGSY